MNDSTIAFRAKEQLGKFLGNVFTHFSKPRKKFLADMLYGIQGFHGERLGLHRPHDGTERALVERTPRDTLARPAMHHAPPSPRRIRLAREGMQRADIIRGDPSASSDASGEGTAHGRRQGIR